MSVIAFDPGLRSLGVAVLDSDGRVSLATSKAPAKLSAPQAYWVQYKAISSAISLFEPDTIIMEGPAYGAGGGRFNMEQLAVVRGLIEMVADPRPVRRIAPSSLKKYVTGNGRATKTDVFAKLCEIAAARNWTLPGNTDEADALGLLLMGAGE